jgi:isoleucyl-tRNA synthetase
MPFDKVETQIDLPAQERAILEFWNKTDAFEKLRAKNRGNPRWSFLDGPITANNPMGVHHAWGRTYKDVYQRYFAMTGHELRYQNGFDCQGLWVEVEVERELGLKSKRDIEELVPGDRFKSIDKFVNLCKERVNKFARRQTDQSIRLGYWMDWDRTDADWAKPPDERKSYFTMSQENNYTIWSFLKKCHQRGLVYRGYDAMPWCARCGVGISQQEMHEGYQLVAHRAVFVRFPLKRGFGVGASETGFKESLLIWTTTPWTLTSNVAAAVNPALTYVLVKHRDEHFWLAKGALTAQRLEEQFKRKEWVEGVPKLKSLEQIFKEKGGYEIVGHAKGEELIGWEYAGPFDELDAQAAPSGYPEEVASAAKQQGWASEKSAKQVHRVIAWEAVGETEGTGIVHIAPGCGAEDYELGKEQHLVAVAPLDESGVFREGFGFLAGKSAIDHATTDAILDNLKQKGVLLDVEKYPHSYPHCWRCKTELLFRLVDEWFINMSWRDEIMEVVRQTTFLPESIGGQARELDWLKNMGDWMISKKRFWGLALPIWVDDVTGDFEIIGSREELKERAALGWDKFEGHTPHRPWIDLVKIRNPKTGNLMSRIGDVGNPWLDAGIVPYSTMGYNRDRAEWQKWFPADFITESFPGQFRNWFYAILAMSTMMEGRPPTKVILGHAMVRDEHGEEMHKSKGNAIPFEGASDTGYELKEKGKPVKHPPMGSDLMRWMFCRQNPAANINFGPHVAEEVRSKVIMKLWNTYAFFCNYARLDGFVPPSPPWGEGPGVRGNPAAAQPLTPPSPQRGEGDALQDIDRWILSDLQLLVKTAHEAFQNYNVMAFCLKAEEFIDDKLSNWYVRRNRRRFWKSEKGADKTAAYQTLYTVLRTLTKLIAPVVPFVAEAMWQNLKTAGSEESVHHADYPQPDERLIDSELSQDMEALLRLVSLGSAARNTVKIKVRQPLAELRIQPGSDADRRAVERFADQIADELNLKKVTLYDAAQGPLLTFEVKANPKNLGPKFGNRMKAVHAALAALAPAAVAEQVQAGKSIELQCSDGPATLEPSDVWVLPKVADGFAGLVDRGTQLLLDARITPELAREGMAREVIRHVQNSRKDANLQMEDRIVLYLHADDAELAQAIRTHRDYIAGETLVVDWSDKPLGEAAFGADVEVDKKKLRIELKKWSG